MSSGIQQKIIFWICLINGVCAVFFGGLMILFPLDTPLGLGALLPAMDAFPFQEIFFQSLFWSGLALFFWNGSMNLAAVVAFMRKAAIAPKLSLVAGLMLIAWCVFESIYLFNAAAIFYGVVGLVQVVLSWQVMKTPV